MCESSAATKVVPYGGRIAVDEWMLMVVRDFPDRQGLNADQRRCDADDSAEILTST